MRIWPVIQDSQPSYLRGSGRSTSLLFAPLGRSTLLEQVISSLRGISTNPPLVVPPAEAEPGYARWVQGLCAAAQVAATPEVFSEALEGHELSDVLLIIDPRCMPTRGFDFSELVREHAAEPRVAHHLVAFEAAFAGTKERVSFDARGHIRGIQRYYEHATWPFVSGISATLVPCASGLQAEGLILRSLAELRQGLTCRGVPSRDIPIRGGTLDLGEESGILAANEQRVLEAIRHQGDVSPSTVFVGGGHTIHANAKLMGPVVVHPDAWIDEDATVLGPAVIGAGARVRSGAVVAHATIGPDCIVPPNLIVRDRAWFKNVPADAGGSLEAPLPTYGERLARLSLDGHSPASARQQRQENRRWSLRAKRLFDIGVASIGLALLTPVMILIAVAIWLESRGPAFYGDKREGRNGREFPCWKFRTMFTGAHLAQRELEMLNHTDGPHFKVDRDPRVTQIGRILRALNFDEIPQLLNVLVGEMSLVGPRPSPFRENQVCVPWREARLSVRPGITGFWQVCRHDRSAGDFHQWIEYDLLYVQNLSFWLDVKILLATALTLGGKALHVPASWLVASRHSVVSISSPAVEPRHEVDEAVA